MPSPARNDNLSFPQRRNDLAGEPLVSRFRSEVGMPLGGSFRRPDQASSFPEHYSYPEASTVRCDDSSLKSEKTREGRTTY
jgi:hypothetical protein